MVVVCKARQATRADIPGMHRVRLAVKENMLSSPDRISEADYISSIEVNGRGWVAESGDNIVAFAIGHATDGNIWAPFVDPASSWIYREKTCRECIRLIDRLLGQLPHALFKTGHGQRIHPLPHQL